MCKGDINRHRPKTAKINLGLNHHVLNSRTALTHCYKLVSFLNVIAFCNHISSVTCTT